MDRINITYEKHSSFHTKQTDSNTSTILPFFFLYYKLNGLSENHLSSLRIWNRKLGSPQDLLPQQQPQRLSITISLFATFGTFTCVIGSRPSSAHSLFRILEPVVVFLCLPHRLQLWILCAQILGCTPSSPSPSRRVLSI